MESNLNLLGSACLDCVCTSCLKNKGGNGIGIFRLYLGFLAFRNAAGKACGNVTAVGGIAKAVGEMSAALSGKVDQIILTGGVAYSPVLVPDLKSRIDWIAPVTV